MIKELSNKKLPITVIITIITAVGGLIWSAALVWDKFEKYDTRIAQLEGDTHGEYVYDDTWVREWFDEVYTNVERLTLTQDAFDPTQVTKQIASVVEQLETLRRDLSNVPDTYDDTTVTADVERLIALVEGLQHTSHSSHEQLDVSDIVSSIASLKAQVENLQRDMERAKDDIDSTVAGPVNPLSI